MAVRGNTRNTGGRVVGTAAALLGLLLIGGANSLLVGCAKQDPRNVVIAPGQFVPDEPTVIASGKPVKSKKCSLDSIDDDGKAKERSWKSRRGNGISMIGWAFQNDGTAAGNEVYVRLTGAAKTYYAVTTSRHLRTDVNEYHRVNPGEAGFKLTATTEQIEPGIYEIAILIAAGGNVETCDADATVVVN